MRSRALLAIAGDGGMLSVATSREAVTPLLDRWAGRISVAAVNGPSAVVVSGDDAALRELAGRCEADGIRAKHIPVDYASHSAHVTQIRERLLADLAPVTPRAGELPIYSTVTGDWLSGAELDAGYWYTNLRETVNFERATRGLLESGYRVFVECSAHPVLTSAIGDTVESVPGAADESVVTGSLRRDDGGLDRFLTSAAEAWVRGVGVDLGTVFGDGTPTVELPTYAFQRRRYWLDAGLERLMSGTAGDGTGWADGGFWEAVESADPAALAGVLRLDEESARHVLPALSAWRQRRRTESVAESWRYRIGWSALESGGHTTLAGRWLVVAPERGAEPDLAHRVAAALTGAGAEPTVLTMPTDQGRAAIGASLTGVTADGAPVTGVLSLLAFDEADDREHPVVPHGLGQTLALIQALGDVELTAPLWCVTRGAVAASPAEAPTGPVQAQVWGLGRVAALEHSHRWGGLVDLPDTVDDDALTRLCAVLAAADEDQVAVRASGLFGRRLLRGVTTPARDTWRPRGTVLVTGGTGALGGHVARWLADGGAGHLVLTSRRGDAAPGADELLAELTDRGVRASVVACDIADRDSVARLVGDLRAAGETVNAVVHTAGVVSLAPLADSTVADFAGIAAGKVSGARHLAELLDRDELDAIVYFSSIAGVWGVGDHGGYAAANAYLDALAQRQRADGLPAHSVAWGPWAGGGMIVEQITDVLRRRGVPVIEPEPSMVALQHAMDRDETVPVIADIDWERFAPVFSTARPSPLLRDIPDARPYLDSAPDGEAAERAAVPLAGQLAALTVDDQERALRDLVRGHAARVLGHQDADGVDVKRAFMDMGFDSLTAVELRNALNGATGLKLPATAVFDYPSVTALAGFLRTELVGGAAGPVAGTEPGVAPDDDPVAIVGMSCRYAGGVASPDDLWQLLLAGGDAVSMFPTDRGWDTGSLYQPDPDRGEGSYVREGGFLHDAAEFDPAFFGISPREAVAMDPQQRLVLETAWEAFERAGINQAALRGSQAGVFLGMADQGYAARLQQSADGTDGYLVTGGQSSVASGRIAYAFGLEGPAITVDTACSSSLVALHLAAESLRRGECRLALTGGAAVMSTPVQFVGFSRQRGLAADGRCKPFADAADGFGLAEGVGMLVLERLSDATANGHPVLAVVRGSAVNQDGASNGLTAPNGPSQQRVIRQALTRAALVPSDVDVVEAHGTGTTLGDPIEAQALLATYGRDRPADRPLWLGSVKSNIGHAQTASGVAGVIKMVLSMRHGLVPKTLHIDAPSSHVDWSAGTVRLLTEHVSWPDRDAPRRAGVSSFGISGTNAHVILEQPATQPAAEPATQPSVETGGVPAPSVPWVVSARGEDALRAQARRLLAHVEAGPELDAVDVGHSLVATRSPFEHRAVVVGADRAELGTGLAALAAGQPAAELVEGVATVDGRIALVFPGQGAQWVGMAVELLDTSPVFAARFREVAAALAGFTDWSAEDVLRGAPAAPGLDRVDVVQPLSFAVMVALAELWHRHGVRPDAVVGHSQGEIAAACVAGVLSLQDAARVVVLRSRAILALAGGGAMASVALPADQLADRLSRYGGAVTVAAHNGPSSTVVSGTPAAIDELVVGCESDEIRARRIAVDYASHSPQVELLRDELTAAMAPVRMREGQVPMFSTVTGEWLRPAEEDGGYWFRNLRERVGFEDAVRGLAAEGYRIFVECSPHPVLTTAVGQTLEAVGRSAEDSVVTGSLRRDEGGLRRFHTSLAEAYVRGVPVDWEPVFDGLGARRVELPTYAFQRDRFWVNVDTAPSAVDGPLDAEFWRAVQDGDLAGLTGDTDVDAQTWERVLPALSSWHRRRDDESTVDRWRYRIGWSPLSTGDSGTLAGRWLVAVPAGTLPDTDTARIVADVRRGLAQHGAEVAAIEVATGSPAEVADTLRALAGPVTGVLSLLALDERPTPGHPVVPVGLAGSIALAQALAETGIEAPLWCATRSAVSVGSADPVTRPVQAQVWGLGTVLGLDEPARWGGMVDLPEILDGAAVDRLCGVLGGATRGEQVAVRASGVFGRRMVRAALEGRAPVRSWRPRGTVLVTGGTGSLGAHTARWLARNGAGHIVLTSRRGPAAPGATELREELVRSGARVTVVACDVAERAALERLLAQLPADEPVTAVFHAAGVPGDGTPLGELDVKSVAEVMAAKVAGARHLEELLDPAALDAFVLFSSGAGVWGNGGQIAYAAANSYLDAFARRRRAAGAPATSVCWGAWAGGGMIDDAQSEALSLRGVREMSPDLAVAALQRALDHDEQVVVVADIDWERFLPAYTFAAQRPLLDELAEARQVGTPNDGPAGPAPEADSLAQRLAALPDAERDRTVLDLVRGNAAAVLRHTGTDGVRANTPFKQLGFDSLTAVEFRNRLNAATGVRLAATVVFDHPTPRALADHLRSELVGDPDGELLAELDRLGSVLAAGDVAEATRDQIGDRLRAMLALCGGGSDRMAEHDMELGGATDDEMFDLIDRELAAHDRSEDRVGD
ncbi:MAG: SDR family NAD(P)-dependent oxidoreductase [Actinocatenispora sp.]